MVSADVNILVHAFRDDASEHHVCRRWLQSTLDAGEALAHSNAVLSGFVRIVTHPKIFELTTPLEAALDFVDVLRSAPTVMRLEAGPRHWEIFANLCRLSGAKANLVTDAYLAALAIESDCDWISTDRDFRHFPGLRWRNPAG